TLLFVSAPGGIRPESAQQVEELPAVKEGVDMHYIQYDLIEAELQSTLRRDTIVLAAISLCLILLGFFSFTKSLRGLGLIGLMVSFNIALTFLAMSALSMRFTVHMITIPCIITVLSFTDIMHILYHQQIQRDGARTDRELQDHIIGAVRIPLLLTSATNIVGFVIFLIFARNIHLFNFSLAAILGVTFGYLSARLLVIRLMGKDNLFIKRTDFEGLNRWHSAVAHWVRDKKNTVLPAFLTVSLVLLTLVSTHLTIDGSEAEYTLTGSRLAEGIEILQREFFGAKQAEVFISVEEGSLWDKTTLNELEVVEAEIERIFHPLYINSPLVVVKRYHRYLSGGAPGAFLIPPVIGPDYAARLEQHKARLGGTGIIDSTATRASLVFGFPAIPLPEARAGYAQLRQFLDTKQTDRLHFQLSGLQYLSDEATHRFSVRILAGLALSILFGSLVVMLLLRSLRQGVGLLLVNLFPIFFALGIMLCLGIAITPLTLFLLSILLGICVDDSVYLLFQDRDATSSPHIVPIFITSFVLSLGFLSLASSSFTWLRPFGWIFLAGIGLAYVLDIFILPLFLHRKTEP
ncbi:MAG: hypothetical protein KDC54_00140, partial [Lewinella sp.]|nr:hypothetical protein [Lewinella sp.]